ncbi:hypothetical protein Pmar_PMAR005031, partial [Perkinsus marinus ATCC 50983]
GVWKHMHMINDMCWYMLSVPEDMDQVAAHVLCGVNAGCKPLPTRPPRKAYDVREYVVRGFFYQAVNLPISDPGGLSDPFVKMSIGGISGSEFVDFNLKLQSGESHDEFAPTLFGSIELHP